MTYSEGKLKSNGNKHLLVSNHLNMKHVQQMLAYPDSAIRFIQTHFYYPYQFHGDIKLIENIIQDLSPKS